MKLTFLGAAREVTGSCTQLEAAGHRLLVDCGMEQGRDVYENADLPYAPGTYEALLLTHAHIDHSGRSPTSTKTATGAPSIPPMPPWTCAASCCGTLPTSRSRKPSGKTARPSAAAPPWWNRITRWRMPRRSCSSLCPAPTAPGRPSSRARTARSKCCSPMWGIFWAVPPSPSASPSRSASRRSSSFPAISATPTSPSSRIRPYRPTRTIWSWSPPTATAATARGRTIWAN